MAHARKAAQDLSEAEDSLKEIRTRVIGSPSLDGLPRGGGAGDPTGCRVAHVAYAERKVDKARKELDLARRVARRVCARIVNPHARKFCESYFVEGAPFEVAQIVSGVQERQCFRYMQKVNA